MNLKAIIPVLKSRSRSRIHKRIWYVLNHPPTTGQEVTARIFAGDTSGLACLQSPVLDVNITLSNRGSVTSWQEPAKLPVRWGAWGTLERCQRTPECPVRVPVLFAVASLFTEVLHSHLFTISLIIFSIFSPHPHGCKESVDDALTQYILGFRYLALQYRDQIISLLHPRAPPAVLSSGRVARGGWHTRAQLTVGIVQVPVAPAEAPRYQRRCHFVGGRGPQKEGQVVLLLVEYVALLPGLRGPTRS